VKNAIDQCMPTDPFAPGRPALTMDWSAEPRALGGRPGYGPQAWAARGVLTQPLGRLHLAGDYNGSRPGTMDAAVESGRQAARQIAG
jgi:monoamine oxidase